MAKAIAVGMVMAFVFAGAAYAEPVSYTWTGMGVSVPGSSKCSTYRMTIDVTVDGKSVTGVLKQQGRETRQFETKADANGIFKAKVQLGDDNSMNVTGVITGNDGRVLLDGYCKFEGKLTRK
jgi:hypothetical protein